MTALLNRLKKASKVDEIFIMSDSKFGIYEQVPTQVPVINIALSANVNGGLEPGLTIWAGPSKHFKTLFSLIMVKSYLDRYPDAACIFYDSEFGASKKYFESVGVDTSRVLHIPVKNIEELKFDVVTQLEGLEKDDKVIILIDSIGNLASKKEVDDALSQNSAADMTRAKQMKSLFRMVTPYLTLKNIPMVAVNHVYQGMGTYDPVSMSGGTGPMFSANTVFFLGKRQIKDGSELLGYEFVIKVEKSRRVREKSQFMIEVNFTGGVNKYSGLLDIALESGHVIKPKNGWYQVVDMISGEVAPKNYRKADTNSPSFWEPILRCPKFIEYVETRFGIANGNLLDEEDNVDDYKDLGDDE